LVDEIRHQQQCCFPLMYLIVGPYSSTAPAVELDVKLYGMGFETEAMLGLNCIRTSMGESTMHDYRESAQLE
jgi:hypothetical protein